MSLCTAERRRLLACVLLLVTSLGVVQAAATVTFSNGTSITSEAFGAVSVFAVDLDGDGDVDVLSACQYDNGGIYWYENLDGEGDFSGGMSISYVEPSTSSTNPSLSGREYAR